MVYAIGDALADKVGQLLVQIRVLQQHGAAGTDRKRVFIAWCRSAGMGCCDGSFCLLLGHLSPPALSPRAGPRTHPIGPCGVTVITRPTSKNGTVSAGP